MLTAIRNSTDAKRTGIFETITKKLLAAAFLVAWCLFLPFRLILRFLTNLWTEISALEQMFIKLSHIYPFVCQLFFLTLCEVAIVRQYHPVKKEEKIVTGPTTLLLYSVFGYFVSKIRNLCVKDWREQRGASTGMYRCYAWWFVKIAIEWAKAIIVVVYIKEQGMKYRPDLSYNLATFSYYLCTEKVFVELLESMMTRLNLDWLDSLEYLYVPTVLYSYSVFASVVVTAWLYSTGNYPIYALFSSYFLIYLRLKDVILNCVCPLLLERRTYASFKTATSKDIEKWDDICAVCLSRMSKARITPCNHLFHPQCLKLCLKVSYRCPLCKQNFIC